MKETCGTCKHRKPNAMEMWDETDTVVVMVADGCDLRDECFGCHKHTKACEDWERK